MGGCRRRKFVVGEGRGGEGSVCVGEGRVYGGNCQGGERV